MSSESLGTPHTIWSLLKQYDRIEIPIIQRDYAQGRKSAKSVRDGILNHILEAVSDNRKVELDFIYGVERPYKLGDDEQIAFVPIDGQQRLTTLWLVHWYLANKAGLLDDKEGEAVSLLGKFTYETRPSSKRFIECLCTEPVTLGPDLRETIVEDAPWFDEAWKLDPSIMGAITVLEAIASHDALKKHTPQELLTNLTQNDCVTFYFLPLEKFGLGEEIYTRMNARGKVLTDFEKVKSKLFKIINESPLKKVIADKIEYKWVEDLWPYRPKGTYLTDTPFIKWLGYITQILYVVKNGNTKDDVDYTSEKVLSEIYSSEENLRFLIHSLDSIPDLVDAPIDFSMEWDENAGLAEHVRWILNQFSETNTDVMKQLGVMAALIFLDERKGTDGIGDFMRVVRNLIENTADKSLREWPTLIGSIRNLVSPDVYAVLRQPELSLKGFRREQRDIEIFKAKLIESHSDAYSLICKMDDNSALHGRLGNIIIENQEPVPTDKFKLALNDIAPKDVDIQRLNNLFEAYESMRTFASGDDFNGIWGDLLNTRLYKFNEYVCWYDDENDNYSDYNVHPVLLKLAREIADNNDDIDATLVNREKKFVKKMLAEYGGDFATASSPKHQLYLFYIMTVRFMDMTWQDFFMRYGFNFGWVKTENGYTTPFDSPLVINGEPISSTRNIIYQTYKTRFVEGYGVVNRRTPRVLVANQPKRRNIFRKLTEWAES